MSKANKIPTRDFVIDTAKSLISGQRQRDYGDAKTSFEEIADYWSTYLGIELCAEDIAIMMALMKIARIKTGSGTIDSFIDSIGYMALGAEIHANDMK